MGGHERCEELVSEAWQFQWTATAGFGDETYESTVERPLQVATKEVRVLEPNPRGDAGTMRAREELSEMVGGELGQCQLSSIEPAME